MNALHAIDNAFQSMANAAALATSASDAGVVVAVDHNFGDPEFAIWAVGPTGRIVEHKLSARHTDFARLIAHLDGFIENHRCGFAAAA